MEENKIYQNDNPKNGPLDGVQLRTDCVRTKFTQKRQKTVIKEMDPDTIILCKRLIGYSETELRAINIKDNTHSGDWDMDLLADWTADLTVDLGLEKASIRISSSMAERTHCLTETLRPMSISTRQDRLARLREQASTLEHLLNGRQ